MSKVRLADELADALGTSRARAARFVDDVGQPRAQQAARTAQTTGSEGIQTGQILKYGAGAGALGGGGLLLAREQDVRQTQQETEAASDVSDALQSIVESDLTPEERQAALSNLGPAVDAATDNADFSPLGGGSVLPDVPGLDGVVPTLAIILIGLFVLYRLADDDADGVLP